MNCLPEKTIVNQKIPKEAFYKNLKLSNKLKKSLIDDIESIVVTHSLTNDSLGFESTTVIEEILLVTIDLRRVDYNISLIETILKSNPHKLLIKLNFNNRLQYLFYENKLYKSAWKDSFNLDYQCDAKRLDKLWLYLIIQVLGFENNFDSNKDLIAVLEDYDKIKKLEVSIEVLERKIYKEVQPKKKFRLYKELQLLKQSLEECING
jgi:hypothetical protein